MKVAAKKGEVGKDGLLFNVLSISGTVHAILAPGQMTAKSFGTSASVDVDEAGWQLARECGRCILVEKVHLPHSQPPSISFGEARTSSPDAEPLKHKDQRGPSKGTGLDM